MSDYALYEDPDTKEKSYKRFAPRVNDGGNFPDFKHFKFDGPDSSSALKFAVSIHFIYLSLSIFVFLI
uniref:Uncharacterized protein n=1 Tax=Sinocyclocheilus rhinocerous TaxID=307959 RepID=A0A673FVS0_9TELE